nr:hypothetical protein [Tanacetum cinerariifolium]
MVLLTGGLSERNSTSLDIVSPLIVVQSDLTYGFSESSVSRHLKDTTKLKLTEPRWDASDFLFKEDYVIVSKPRAMIYRDRNDQKKMLRENEVHKFSNGTLTRVLHKLDHMVKDFRMFKYNPSMENKIWSVDDKKRSEEFMEVIERRLKI